MVIFRLTVLFLFICVTSFVGKAQQPTNLLLGDGGKSDPASWNKTGDAMLEELNGEPVFVVRNKGGFVREISLSSSDVGKYALMIGVGSSERINADGAITGLPALYGYMINPNRAEGSIQEYLQGQKMLARPSTAADWALMYGVFRIPKGTRSIRFFLNQAERKNVPQNGSAARFYRVGLYVFETEEAAKDFASGYRYGTAK